MRRTPRRDAEVRRPDRSTAPSVIRVGTAGWSIPAAVAPRFDTSGTHLWRYARRLTCAEINSSFYRPHAAATYARWRDSTPPDFRFAVKLPRTITHEQRLEEAREPLTVFLDQTAGLAEKRGPILVQLPPSLECDAAVATGFFALLRSVYDGAVVCEPRHASWFTAAADALLDAYGVARVGADPALAPSAAGPRVSSGVAYWRLHGAPRTYWSRYDAAYLSTLAMAIRQQVASATQVWCIFDNTASGAAAANALELSDVLGQGGRS